MREIDPASSARMDFRESFRRGFKDRQEFLISIRTPNDRLEETSRHIHSLMTALLTNVKAYRLGLGPPVKYMVIPYDGGSYPRYDSAKEAP